MQDVKKAFFLCLLNNKSRVPFFASKYEYESTSSLWIPDLPPKLIKFVSYCSASGRSCHEIVYESKDESLRLPANPVGVISSVWFIAPQSLATLLEFVRAHAQPNTKNQAYVHDGNWLDAYVATLTGGRYREVSSGAPHHLTLQELRDAILFGGLSKETVDTERIGRDFICLKGRAFCSTTNGSIGIFPPSARIGTRYMSPLVLRFLSLYPALRVTQTIIGSRVDTMCMA